MIKYIMEEIKQKINEIKSDPLSNTTLEKYLPNVPIITYPQLKNYKSLEDLLPNPDSMVIILYLDTPNSGHWVGLLRDNNVVEYFDSYGNKPDEPLSWNGGEKNKALGIAEPYLTNLIKNTPFQIIYNKKAYQKTKPDISTCGRHLAFRMLAKRKMDLDLQQYNKLMKKLEQETKLDSDNVVSGFIDDMDK